MRHLDDLVASIHRYATAIGQFDELLTAIIANAFCVLAVNVWQLHDSKPSSRTTAEWRAKSLAAAGRERPRKGDYGDAVLAIQLGNAEWVSQNPGQVRPIAGDLLYGAARMVQEIKAEWIDAGGFARFQDVNADDVIPIIHKHLGPKNVFKRHQERQQAQTLHIRCTDLHSAIVHILLATQALSAKFEDQSDTQQTIADRDLADASLDEAGVQFSEATTVIGWSEAHEANEELLVCADGLTKQIADVRRRYNEVVLKSKAPIEPTASEEQPEPTAGDPDTGEAEPTAGDSEQPEPTPDEPAIGEEAPTTGEPTAGEEPEPVTGEGEQPEPTTGEQPGPTVANDNNLREWLKVAFSGDPQPDALAYEIKMAANRLAGLMKAYPGGGIGEIPLSLICGMPYDVTDIKPL